MIDVSFGIPYLPAPDDPLNTDRANAIEWNLYALIRAWPVFESRQVLPSVGSYGYLQLDETASPGLGVTVTECRHLPRLLVFLTGKGRENLFWTSTQPWKEENGVLIYDMTEISVENANAALAQLFIGSTGDADITVTLAGENLGWEPESLRLYGDGKTMLLFRSKATWNLAKALRKTWDGAKPLTWDEAAALRKGGSHETE
ncbi:MAG: hypothetical protein HDR88_06075 [Bacteroides sp.]|nr:hypothetical protein [Bacteroides sp.]MBD5356557.1 hypothetical protein [Bacteroides sp.]